MFDRALPSFSQILNGLLAESGPRKVVRYQLGLRLNRLGKSCHQDIGNPAMELFTLATHQTGIGRILDQRMLEAVGRIRWFASHGDQFTGGDVRESGL